jgi:hemoglobin
VTFQPGSPINPADPADPSDSGAPSEPAAAGPSLLDRLGGRDAVEAVVDAFYSRVEGDEELRAVFPDDLGPGREKQKLFMEQWLGGEPRYSERYGHPQLRLRHFPFVISERAAGRWMRHMTGALRESGAADDLVAELLTMLGPLAQHMVNEGQPVPREPLADPYLS